MHRPEDSLHQAHPAPAKVSECTYQLNFKQAAKD